MINAGPDQRHAPRLSPFLWAAARLGYHAFVIAGMMTGGLFFFLVAPVSSWVFLGTWRFWRYWPVYPGLIAQPYKLLRRLLRDPRAYAFDFSVPLTAPPLHGPAGGGFRLQASWAHGAIGCHGCARCCEYLGCPLLDRESRQCLSFGSFHWRYFTCGAFPAGQTDISRYQCPKWELVPGEER